MGAGLLCAFGGVLLLLFPNYVPLLIVIRLTAGIGHSLAFITGLLHGSENCHKDHRTALVSKFPLRMLAGAVWSSSMISTEDYADDTGIMDVNQLTALAVTLVSLAAALPAPFFTYPSLIDLVRRRDYDQVKHIMQRLRHESTETPEIRSDFEVGRRRRQVYDIDCGRRKRGAAAQSAANENRHGLRCQLCDEYDGGGDVSPRIGCELFAMGCCRLSGGGRADRGSTGGDQS